MASVGRERFGLLVVGMHRSGTSAATRVISLLGPRLPANLMPSHAEFNAAGFWESLDVVALNESLLATAFSSWDDVLPIDTARLPAQELARFQESGRELLLRDFGGSDWFVLKDPRIGRLLRLWVEIVQGAGAVPLVVIPVRHPLEVAASLRHREGFSDEKSLYLWLRHMIDVIRSSRDVRRAVMDYDELMRDWRTSVDRVARDLGIHWPRQTEEIAAEAEQFLDPKLRHHALAVIPQQDSLVGRLALELHEALRRRAGDLDAMVDALHEQLLPLEAVFAPLQRDAVRRVAVLQAKNLQQQQEHGAHALALEAEIRDLQAQRARATERMAELESTLQSERAAHADFARAFDEKAGHVRILERELAQALEQRDHALAHVTELEGVIASERLEHARLSAAFDDKVRHLEVLASEIQSVRHAFEDKSRQAGDLAVLLEQSRQALDQARLAVARIDAALS